MSYWLKRLFKQAEQIKNYEKNIVALEVGLATLKLKQDEDIVERAMKEILGKDIKWFDYSELSVDKQRTYFEEAQTILNTDVFSNECKAMVEDIFIDNMVKNVSNDTQRLRDGRVAIVTLDLLKKRIEDVKYEIPQVKEKIKDPHSAI